ncbi:hypothetical protein ACDT10_22695, partial [Mycobacterium intracellulare]|uniref:hypothetical protein n=1 Tax=Mycobacterium intracellulare TaxID=1767 RepID=UPI003559333E
MAAELARVESTSPVFLEAHPTFRERTCEHRSIADRRWRQSVSAADLLRSSFMRAHWWRQRKLDRQENLRRCSELLLSPR